MNNQRIILFALWIKIIIIFIACNKEKTPIISTTPISDITAISATGGGSISDDGGATIINRGVCWSTDITPKTSDSKTSDGAGAGTFSSNLTGLNGGTTYYVRAYATNSIGTGYGMAMSFKTLGLVPTATTESVTNKTASSATLNGKINAHYLQTQVSFEYGTTNSYGKNILSNQSPVTGNTTTDVSANVTDLTLATTYHFRVMSTNSLGTSYGNDMVFTTLGDKPVATSQAANNIQGNTATLNGIVNPNYSITTANFEYGNTTNYGYVIQAIQSPINGSSEVNVSANISGLTTNTLYHFRLKAENSLGITYSPDLTFKTLMTGQIGNVTDNEGNTYRTIGIGSQVWMADNLKVTKYNNGDIIGTTTPANLNISGENNPKYQWSYNGNESNVDLYGRLYTWYAVTDTRGVCPTGWHIPSNSDFTVLETYLINYGYGFGGSGNDIGKTLAATSNWNSCPIIGTPGYDPLLNNNSGFQGLPTGTRWSNGTFVDMGNGGFCLSSTSSSTDWAPARYLNCCSELFANGDVPKNFGHFVRCVKD